MGQKTEGMEEGTISSDIVDLGAHMLMILKSDKRVADAPIHIALAALLSVVTSETMSALEVDEEKAETTALPLFTFLETTCYDAQGNYQSGMVFGALAFVGHFFRRLTEFQRTDLLE